MGMKIMAGRIGKVDEPPSDARTAPIVDTDIRGSPG
jgi:hypothetical protein